MILRKHGALVIVEPVEFVQRLDDAIGSVADAKFGENRFDVPALRVAVWVSDVANMDNHIG
jgi:hypothetical protein